MCPVTLCHPTSLSARNTARGRLVSPLDIFPRLCKLMTSGRLPRQTAEFVMEGSLTAAPSNTTIGPLLARNHMQHCNLWQAAGKSRASTCCGCSALQELYLCGCIHGICAAVDKAPLTQLGAVPREQGPALQKWMRQKENSFLLGDMPCNPRKGMTSLQMQYTQVDQCYSGTQRSTSALKRRCCRKHCALLHPSWLRTRGLTRPPWVWI